MGSRASSCPCLIPASPKGTIINSVALSRGYKLKLEALVEGHEWRWDSWVTDHPLTGKKVWVDIRIFQETWLMCKSHFLFCVLWGFKWFGLLFADRGQMFRTMSQIVLRQKTCHDQIYWRQNIRNYLTPSCWRMTGERKSDVGQKMPSAGGKIEYSEKFTVFDQEIQFLCVVKSIFILSFFLSTWINHL